MNKELKINFFDLHLIGYLFEESKWIKKILEIRELFNYYKSVNVVVFNSIEELSNVLGLKVPHWVVGTCIGDTILLLEYKLWKDRNLGTFSQIFIHEFIHIIIGDLTKYNCPIWLNEGLASYFSEQYTNSFSKKSEYSINKDIYDLDYKDKGLYEISLKAVALIIEIYGLDTIIYKISYCNDFQKDDVLGKDNMRKII